MLNTFHLCGMSPIKLETRDITDIFNRYRKIRYECQWDNSPFKSQKQQIEVFNDLDCLYSPCTVSTIQVCFISWLTYRNSNIPEEPAYIVYLLVNTIIKSLRFRFWVSAIEKGIESIVSSDIEVPTPQKFTDAITLLLTVME